MLPILWVSCAAVIVGAAFRARRNARARGVGRWAVAVLFVAAGALVNAGLLAAGESYAAFADGAYLAFVRDTWRDLVVPNYYLFISLLIVFEAGVGLLVLAGGRLTQVGLAAAIAFHVALLSFGWGFFLWSIPMVWALGILLRAERHESSASAAEVIRDPRIADDDGASVDLYWIPLGAGGHSVRLNGIVYEALSAALQGRPRRDIYHCALEVRVPRGRYAIEMTPVPNGRSWERGVVVQGAVGSRWAGWCRLFRYEVRCWREGVIPDLGHALGGPIRLTDDAAVAEGVLEQLPLVPALTWGRDESGTGEMWSCNSIVSWALRRAGVDTGVIPLPPGGRAPGWDAGIMVAARRDAVTSASLMRVA
jgi:hypothetical protein